MDKKTLDSLFPFHVVLDENGLIISMGMSMAKVIGKLSLSNSDIDNYLKFKRSYPFFESLESKKPNHELLEVITFNGELELSGTICWYEQLNCFVLYLTPFVHSTKQLEDLQLTYEDFSPFDSSIDNLAIIQAQKGLISEARDKESDLIKKNEMLININKSLDEFVYHVSHDLKSPIVNLEGMLYMLTSMLSDNKTSEIQNILGHMQTCVDRFNQTIEDFLELTKVTKGKLGEVRLFNSSNKIKDLFLSFNDQMESIEASINFDLLPEDQANIQFPVSGFSTVANNLISNAIKYRCASRPLNIKIHTYLSGNFLVLSISDNGKGIDLEKYGEKIFGLFDRVEHDIPGHGLGLYLVRSVLEKFDGKISVESSLDKGATFKAYFNR